jgi:hypothetical protein
VTGLSYRQNVADPKTSLIAFGNASSGFSFAAYGDARTMIYVPYNPVPTSILLIRLFNPASIPLFST